MASKPPATARAERTRAALVAAGFELLSERPIDAIPIDDVVTAARVAKGSFFNHFKDKQAFANAIAREVRIEVEELVTAHNHGVDDPIERIAGGMKVAVDFARAQPTRAIALMRSQGASTGQHNPLNRGLRQDIDAALERGQLRPEARSAGVLYWLGLCQALMASMVEAQPGQEDARTQLSAVLLLGLTGLGTPEAVARDIIAKLVAR